MMKKTVLLLSVCLLAACEPPVPLTEYSPVVDPAKIKPAKFNSDLEACRAIAIKVEADYKKEQQKMLLTNLMVGALTGAVVGAAVGSGSNNTGNYAAAGAAYGAAAGAATNDYTHDLVTYGPRRIVDRCMADRGYTILNDAGRGR